MTLISGTQLRNGCLKGRNFSSWGGSSGQALNEKPPVNPTVLSRQRDLVKVGDSRLRETKCMSTFFRLCCYRQWGRCWPVWEGPYAFDFPFPLLDIDETPSAQQHSVGLFCFTSDKAKTYARRARHDMMSTQFSTVLKFIFTVPKPSRFRMITSMDMWLCLLGINLSCYEIRSPWPRTTGSPRKERLICNMGRGARACYSPGKWSSCWCGLWTEKVQPHLKTVKDEWRPRIQSFCVWWARWKLGTFFE